MFKVIFLADIVGKIGRKAVIQYLPELQKRYKPDFVMANAENLAHGIGFTQKTLNEMLAAGVDFFTSGNHAWKKAGADELLNEKSPLVIRPANYLPKKSGIGFKEFKIGKNKLLVVNLLGRVFIEERVGSPFKALEKILKKYKDYKMIIVDFHAEATSEKVALAQYFNGKVSAVLGTHTHVPTCDQKVLSEGTAFVADVGLIGYYDSVIGANKEEVLKMFLGKGKGSKKHDLPDHGQCQFNAVYLEIDEKTGRATKIKRLDKIINIK